MHALLNSIAAHPHGVLLVVFLVAFAESVAFIGTFVPAGIVMFTAGALIGTGALNGWVTLGIAALGAVAGDGLSYELGRRYSGRIRTWPISNRYAAVIDRGERFIQRHGGKSILFARFMGPVRAVVPLITGVAHMPRAKFYSVNIGSALAWSPAHILPGVVFGASIQLAEAVSGRLAVILIIVAALVWFVVWATRICIRVGLPIVKGWRDHLLQWAGRRSSWLTRWMSYLFDPSKQESQVLLVLALLLLGSGWLFFGILEDVIAHDPLVGADAAIFNLLQALRSSFADHLMVGITELGGARVRLSVAVVVGVWLIVLRCWRTVGYWIITVGFAEGAVKLLKLAIGRPRPFGLYSGIEQFSFPSGHATGSVVIYGFLAFLLARKQSPLTRMSITVITAVGVVLIGFSRLYLGAHWLSDVLGGWSLGLAWIALVAVVYTHHQVSEGVRPSALGGLVTVALLVCGTWAITHQFAADLARYTPAVDTHTFTLDQWADPGWRQLPQRRMEISGDNEEFFPVQWAASTATIQNRLTRAGWQPAPPWSAQSALLWLTPNTPVRDLPVLPKYDQGKSSELAFVAFDPARPMTRTVLRLWPSNYTLVNSTRDANVPIWYGALYREKLERPWHLLTLGVAQDFSAVSAIPDILSAELRVMTRSITQNGSMQQVVLVLPENPAMPLSGSSW